MNFQQAFAIAVIVVVVALLVAAIIVAPGCTASGALAAIAGGIAVASFIGWYAYDTNQDDA